MPDFNNCLRPAFTKVIYEKLKMGDSLNIVGGKGLGRSRLLDDLAKAAFEEGILTIRVNLSPYKFNYPGFIDEVNRQQFNAVGKSRKVPKLAAGETMTVVPFAASLSPEVSTGQRQTFLLLDDFDRILDNKQQHFPKQFFDDLNALKNRANVSICCITQQAHNLYNVHYRNEDKVLEDKLSWLDLQIIDLEAFRQADIKAELGRQLKHNENWQKEQHMDTIAKAIATHPKPTLFKEYLVSNYPLNHEGTKNTLHWLKQCKRKFKRHHPQPNRLVLYLTKKMDSILERGLKVSDIIKNIRGNK